MMNTYALAESLCIKPSTKSTMSTMSLLMAKVLKFPVDEAWVLPIANVTVEELAHFLLGELIGIEYDPDLVEVELTVSSGSGQASSATWQSDR